MTGAEYGGLSARSFPLYATALAKRHRELDTIIRRWGLPRFWSRRPGVESLMLIILEQQISIAAARSIYRGLRSTLGGLSARRVHAAGPERLRSLGLTRQKSRYCFELARAVVHGRLSVDGLKRLDDAQATAVLCAQPGIGPWSAAIYLMSALKRIDVWPPGDLALRRGHCGPPAGNRQRGAGGLRRSLAPAAGRRRKAGLASLSLQPQRRAALSACGDYVYALRGRCAMLGGNARIEAADAFSQCP